MAKIAFGGGVSDISGSIGGNTYSRNKGGAYIRRRATPVNPRTALQTIVRNAFANIAAAWRSLTEVQRLTFVTMAPQYPYTDSLGQVKVYTGQQLYVKHNLNNQSVGFSAVSAQVSPIPMSDLSISGFVVDTGDASPVLITGLSATAAGEAILVEATPPLSAGVNNPGNAFRKVEVKNAGTGAGDLDISDSYATTFGTPGAEIEPGSKVFIRLSMVKAATGQASPYLISSAIAV